MTKSEQQKMIRELAYYRTSMTRDDLESFAMLQKRDQDDEDLDALSLAVLDRLMSRYMKKKSRADVEELWKKMTTPPKEE